MFQHKISGVFLSLFFMVLVTGCEYPNKGGVAVIDLDKISVSTGREKLIVQQVQAFAKEQEEKLNQLQVDLQQNVDSAKEKLSEDSSEEEKQSVNAMVLEARNQLTRELDQARQSAQQLKIQLVKEFTAEIQPNARRVAEERGMTVVMIKRPGLYYVAPEADITDAVIDSLQTENKDADIKAPAKP